jgi:hypothetical protein
VDSADDSLAALVHVDVLDCDALLAFAARLIEASINSA